MALLAEGGGGMGMVVGRGQEQGALANATMEFRKWVSPNLSLSCVTGSSNPDLAGTKHRPDVYSDSPLL